jgi:hypothetical protein
MSDKPPNVTAELMRDFAPVVRLDPQGRPIRRITACYLYCNLCGVRDPDLADPVEGRAARRLAVSRGWAVFAPSLVRLRLNQYTVGQLLVLRDLRVVGLERLKLSAQHHPTIAALLDLLSAADGAERPALTQAVHDAEMLIGQAGGDRVIDLCPRCAADCWRQA